MTASRITDAELATIRDRHDDIAQQPLACDDGPIYCRFLGDSETCRGGLDIAEHRLTAHGWQHPDGLDARGYYAFDEEAVQ